MNKKTAFRVSFRVIALLVSAGAVLFLHGCAQTRTARHDIKIGVSLYKNNDAFVSTVVSSLEAEAKAYEQENGVKVTLDVAGAKESQRTQNDQIKRYIALQYDVICVNIVDRTNASVIIDTAMDAGIPLVFFNREPVSEDILRGEHIYYVGTDAKATAVAQGTILADAYEADPASIDRNGDGVIQYVMLEGEIGHQDTLIRTQWSVQILTDRGINVENLHSGAANWDRSQAAALMEKWLPDCKDTLEAVICNNDEMALGAAETLARHGIENVAVLGIDATEAGRQAVADGALLGTVDAGGPLQGEQMFQLAVSLAETGQPPENVKMRSQRYVRIPVQAITE